MPALASATKPRRGRPKASSGGDDVGAAALARNVADALRRLRHERGLSLDKLALASGVSRAALSQIEASKTNPTLAVLWKVAVGLGVPFQTLLGAEGAGLCRVLRSSDRRPLRSLDGRVESSLLTPAGAMPGVEAYELRLSPRGVLQSQAHGLGTTETLVVLTGVVRVSVAEEVHELAPGDSLFFRADVAHAYENRSAHDARCLDLIAYGRPLA